MEASASGKDCHETSRIARSGNADVEALAKALKEK
jgi:hypothetical protein